MINPYLIGNNVYRAGSPAPTVGTVDPMGYVDREQRSQLAQQILNRQQQVNEGSQTGATPFKIDIPIFQDRNDIGNIVPPTPTLPQDSAYTTDMSNAYTNWAQQAEALRQQRVAAQQAYTQQMSDLQTRAETLPDEVRVSLAGRGMGQSSAFAQALADQLENLKLQAQGVLGRRNDVEQSYDTQLSALHDMYLRQAAAANTSLGQRHAANADNEVIGKAADVNDTGDPNSVAINKAINDILNPPKPKSTTSAPKTTTTAPKVSTPTTRTSTPTRPSGVFRVGSSGAVVRSIQEMLNRAGAKLTVDGRYGPATQAAVRLYQSKHGLQADGIVGAQTIGSLWK